MSEIKVAIRYAKALMDLAKEQKAVEEVYADMQLFHDTAKENAQLRAVLANPIISPADKKSIVASLFGKKVNKTTLAFFNIMADKGREAFLYAAAKQFFVLYNQHKGIVIAQVTSATALSASVKKDLITMIEEATRAKVTLEEKIDSHLIGGFVLQIGDKQIDASIARRFRDMKKELAA